jgi:mono/diheme cytochrome c family protein
MRKTIHRLFATSLIGLLLLSACGGGASKTVEPAGEEFKLPAEYQGKTNPLAGNADAASSGQKTYQEKCATCHGDTGLGDGAGGSALNPKPSNLVQASAANGDDYLFWRIETGAASGPANSLMPPWKGVLSEEQIWQVVAFIRTLK